MKEIDVKRRGIGINIKEDKKAEVVVWSPTAEQVAIVLNGEHVELKKEAFGYWRAFTDKIKIGSRYKFLLNGQNQYPDPVSLSQPKGVHESSEFIDVTRFKWTDENWKNVPLEEYIIYELHTGTFTLEGGFASIESKLDHLVSLGITAIEIMPVAQFPGERNWGYDGVFPFAVQNSYGGAESLQNLVNTCHQKGLAVILDVVYNHLGPEGNYLGAFGPYFTDKYKTPWGNAINFDDAWCDGVRRYFIENALMWFRDFHIDALRLDAVHAIKDFSAVHILQEIREYVDQLMKYTGRRHYLIVEVDLNDSRFISPVDTGGYGLDAQWMDDFHHALWVTASGEQTGYYSDFTGIEHLAKAYKDAFVYDGQLSPHRKKKFGRKTNNEGKQFIVFSQNHDQVGNRMLGERSSALLSFEMQKLVAAAVMMSPYLPMLFMGEEWSELNPFLYFVSHTDTELAEAVSKGRKEEFAAFQAEGEAPDPLAEESFLRSKLQWNLMNQGKHKVMVEYYRELIRLRKTNPALKKLNRKNLIVLFEKEQNILILRRWNNEQQVVCFMNFSENKQVIPYDGQLCQRILDSSEPKWGGSRKSREPSANQITIDSQSILIYSSHV
ncbi:MAG: malto-oligosyltrehalose trehalohydrolase [Flavisolibacter sp.]